MRIYVKSNDAPTIRIALPTGLLLNNFSAKVGVKCLGKYIKLDEQNPEDQITAAQARAFFAEIKKMKRKGPNWLMVDIECADGGMV